MNTKLWTTRKGQRIRIKDMKGGHLDNTVCFLRKRAQEHLGALVDDAALITSMFTGDTIASYYADQEFDQVCEMTWEELVPDIYWDMRHEQDRRYWASKEDYIEK